MVFALFQATFDGDGFVSWELLSLHNTLDGAQQEALNVDWSSDIAPIHGGMNYQNGMCVIATRRSFGHYCNEGCEVFGGYIIEELEIKD